MFIHLFNQYLLNANYVLATVGKIMNETKCLCICYNLTKREMINKYIHNHLLFQMIVSPMKKQSKKLDKKWWVGWSGAILIYGGKERFLCFAETWRKRVSEPCKYLWEDHSVQKKQVNFTTITYWNSMKNIY